MATELLSERHGPVAVLTLNRPEARNAINLALAHALDEALGACERDDDVSVVVLTGAGDKAFSAGMDLKAFASGEVPTTEHGFAGLTRHPLTKPLIAAANGVAIAGGFELVLSCDLVVAAEHARFGISEVQRGLIAGAGGLVRLPSRIPLTIALELALTGEAIDAERAYDLGLVNRVVPSDELLEHTLTLARRIAANAPLAVRASKAVLRAGVEAREADVWPLSDETFLSISQSADALEGALAFTEKREPHWRGA